MIYCFIARDSQKFANLMRDPRVSIAIANDVRQPLQIKGLSMAARAEQVEARDEIDHAYALLLQRYPEYKIMPQPDPAAVPLMRFTPGIVSILDYSKGFGHSDLVSVNSSDMEDVVEDRRHHWAGHPAESFNKRMAERSYL